MPRDTQAFMSHQEGQGRAATSVSRALAHLRRFAKWCQDQPGGVFARGACLPAAAFWASENGRLPASIGRQPHHDLLSG